MLIKPSFMSGQILYKEISILKEKTLKKFKTLQDAFEEILKEFDRIPEEWRWFHDPNYFLYEDDSSSSESNE